VNPIATRKKNFKYAQARRLASGRSFKAERTERCVMMWNH
jgi:hypothetical protein